MNLKRLHSKGAVRIAAAPVAKRSDSRKTTRVASTPENRSKKYTVAKNRGTDIETFFDRCAKPEKGSLELPVNEWILMLLLIVLVAAVIGANYAVVVRAKRKVHEWARIDGYIVISATPRWLRTGPFPAADGTRLVFRTQLEDSSGRRFDAWISCGVWPWRRAVECKLDDYSSPQS